MSVPGGPRGPGGTRPGPPGPARDPAVTGAAAATVPPCGHPAPDRAVDGPADCVRIVAGGPDCAG